MWRLLKAAFWFSPPLPAVGRFPANVAAVIGFLILGFGHEGFWVLGLGLETAYLAMLVTNARFQKLVQIEARRSAEEDDETRQQSLIDGLSGEARARLRRLEEQAERLARLGAGDGDADADALVDSNRQALRRYVWLFLKLLVAQQHLQSDDAKGDETRLAAERRQLEADLGRPGLSEALRRSKEATLRILTKRLTNVGRQSQALEEIGSDLKRIEEQIKLSLEEARLKGDRAAVAFDVDLESELVEDSYGAAGANVAALDRHYAADPTRAAAFPQRAPDGPPRR
jgi:hypothetical protein